MRGKERHRGGRFWLDLYACFVIPAYTLLFAGGKAWFQTNFSVLAVKGETYYYGFLIWGLLVGGYFLVVMLSLAASIRGSGLRRLFYGLTTAAAACLVYGLAIPYLPALAPGHARLHVGLVFGACILMMAALLVVLLACWRVEKRKYLPFLLWWSGNAAVSVLLLFLFGKVSSGLEVFFTLSSVFLMRSLWIKRVEYREETK